MKAPAEGHDLKYLLQICKIYYFSDDLFQSSLLSWPIMLRNVPLFYAAFWAKTPGFLTDAGTTLQVLEGASKPHHPITFMATDVNE